ncbi:hypothetical protein HY090_02565 [Candidatus Kaiserbacteria bacterium]|nr:hypothetical protein [Candidatus Kaiserbacteria bacterium]
MENDFNAAPSRVRESALRIFAVLGFVAILGIGIWGSIKIASGVPNALSSLASAFVSLTSVFVPAGETVTLSAPAAVSSGTPFTLSWTHEKKSVEGSYTFRYDCAEGVYFNSPSVSGSQTTIYCNVPFNFLNSGNSMVLTPVSTNSVPASVTIYVDFTPNGVSKATVTGKTALIIDPATAQTPTTNTPTPTQPTYHPVPVTPGPSTSQTYPVSGSSAQVSNPNGRVDLTARVLEVGVVDKNTGAFTASSTPSRGVTSSSGLYRIAVKFAIENIGTKTSPQFDFAAVLPTLPSYVFNSPMQQELAPGDRIEFTLGFDSVDQSGTSTFTVNVDPSGRINESNKDNNIIHYTITTTP